MVQQRLAARDRGRFIACSAQLVRRVLIDHTNRDSGTSGVTLVSALAEEPAQEMPFDALHAALERLARVSTERVRLVELRHFGGLNIDEVAELDGDSSAVVQLAGASRATGCRTRWRTDAPGPRRSGADRCKNGRQCSPRAPAHDPPSADRPDRPGGSAGRTLEPGRPCLRPAGPPRRTWPAAREHAARVQKALELGVDTISATWRSPGTASS